MHANKKLASDFVQQASQLAPSVGNSYMPRQRTLLSACLLAVLRQQRPRQSVCLCVAFVMWPSPALMVIGQEMALYWQHSPQLCLPVWGAALASGSQLHMIRHQDQEEEPP